MTENWYSWKIKKDNYKLNQNKMTNYSTTQTSNLIALAGFLMIVANHFKLNITTEEIQAVLGAGLILGGVIWNWINRYKQGDLTLTGKRI